MIVFGIHCKFFIGFPIRLKTFMSNGFLLFARPNVRARKIGRISEVLRTREPDRHRVRNWSRPAAKTLKSLFFNFTLSHVPLSPSFNFSFIFSV